MGFALGCIHLSFDDFCGCTPEEFESICEAYHEQREADYKDNWERMRLLATYTIQPHVKKKITANKLLPFPWDKPAFLRKRGQKATKPVTAEESKARFEKLVERINGGGGCSAECGVGLLYRRPLGLT